MRLSVLFLTALAVLVGPMADLKLIALRAGTFGRAFALHFSTATTVVAVATSVLIGGALL
ncbi:hypothetical protein ABZ619_27185 [Streptomyces sp. NPDC007851]|uniref:hypothetical protein n=1 Tax=Streptomyces sp. NPDC007851 TaxID=3155008 RepID=UPI0033CFCB47